MTARNEKTPAVIQTHRERIRLWDSGVQTWEGVGDQTSPPPLQGLVAVVKLELCLRRSRQ